MMKARMRRWGRLLGRLALGVVVVLGFLYGVAFAMTFTEIHDRVPREAWKSGDIRAIRTAAFRPSPATTDSMLNQFFAEEKLKAETPPPPPSLANAADQWVATVNRHNPEAILYHEVDSFGNLYVVFGAWWAYLEDGDAQVKALDGLGVAWRQYLRTSFGEWDASEGFEPGIIVVDTEGEVARNINGEIVIFRQANIHP